MNWKEQAPDIFSGECDVHEPWDDRITLTVGYVAGSELEELLALAKANDLSLLLTGVEDGDIEIELRVRQKAAPAG